MLNIIVAISENNVIGKDNNIPWAGAYPEDLRRFKKLTLGCTVVMGRKTWESMNCKALKQRTNIVITSEAESKEYRKKYSGAYVEKSIERAIELHYNIKNRCEQAWFIGGTSIYEEALKYAELIDITYIPEVVKGNNLIKFPDFDRNEWKIWEKFENDRDNRLQHQIFTRKFYTEL
ncbi:hypothetical protein CMI47_12710 [Candidatus Pacearchaeota archaeon]|nr:hypothetical protein [Candidatus Pacearchaeota archaeon]|tara:strand:+ start:1033 stop:1560 length:528 start_codon:yes stop_codon:yes gene_type:complete